MIANYQKIIIHLHIRTVLALSIGLLLLSFSSFAQESEYLLNKKSFFKVDYKVKPNDPKWIKELYSDDPNIDIVLAEYENYFLTHPFKRSIHTQNLKYWTKKVQPYSNGEGNIIIPSPQNKLATLDSLKQARLSSPNRAELWTDIGPSRTFRDNGIGNQRPTQANIYCLEIAPSNNNVMYCAGETGGIFKSTDKAQSWTLISKNEAFTNAQDIKVHPSNENIVYVATDNLLYHSTNGGTTWNLLFSFTNGSTIEQLYIHQINQQNIYAATSNGLYLSTNSGMSWTTLMPGRFWDIKAHTTNPDILFIARNNPSLKRAEIFKSIDAGVQWELKDNNWYMPANQNFANDYGCKIALTPADPNRVYCGLIGESKQGDAGWIGIYHSLDGGDSWVNSSGSDGGPYVSGDTPGTNWYVAGYFENNGNHYHQGWYNFDLVASDINPDKIWIGTIWFCESNDKGASIENVRSSRNLEMHADIQDMEVLNGELWVASDGGLNYSNDEAITMHVLNDGVSSSDYWGFDQGWNEDVFVGGRYHNGNAVNHENYGLNNSLFLGGAEEATGYINQLNNKEAHFSDITDKIIPLDLSQTSVNTFDYAIYPNESYVLNNSSEVHCHPSYANHLYLGNENTFYHSADGGAVFNPLFSFPNGSRVLEFEIARDNPNIIYSVVRLNNNCIIYKSNNGGSDFSPLGNIPSNSNKIDISLNPANNQELWVISKFGNNGNKVFKTEDGGATWINKTTTTLNNHTFVDINVQSDHDDLVYIVSNTGLFYYDNQTNDWVAYNDDLPLIISPLFFKQFYRDNKIRLATARGIWEAQQVKISKPIAQPMTFTDKVYCGNDTIQFDCYSILSHDNAEWQWSITPQPQYINDPSIRNPKVVLGTNGHYDVTLTVTDGNGFSDTKTINNMVELIDNCSADTIPGLAMHLINSGDFANVSDLNINSTNNISFSAWIKPNGNQNPYTGIIMNDDLAAGLNFGPDMKLAYHWPNGQWWWDSGLTVEPEVWSHVAMSVSPNGITVYLNGIASTHTFTPDLVNFESVKFGSYQGWNDRNFKGKIDEVCIWNKNLSQNEIREIRHITRDKNNQLNDHLLHYYQFNLSGTSVINDRIGSKHAVLSGGALKVNSSCPIGSGMVDRVFINNDQDVFFPNTNTNLKFHNNENLNGEIVISRINNSPTFSPVPGKDLNQYWIINNYANNLQNEIVEVSLSPTAQLNLGPVNQISLSNRAFDNDHTDTWENMCTASDVNNQSVIFNLTCQLTNFGQFILTSPSFPSLSIDQPGSIEVQVYPNPSEGIINVHFPNSGSFKIDVINIKGQKIANYQFHESFGAVDLTSDPAGVYILKISGNQKTYYSKVIKR